MNTLEAFQKIKDEGGFIRSFDKKWVYSYNKKLSGVNKFLAYGNNRCESPNFINDAYLYDYSKNASSYLPLFELFTQWEYFTENFVKTGRFNEIYFICDFSTYNVMNVIKEKFNY